MPDLIDRGAVHNMVRQLTRYAWSSPNRIEHHMTVNIDDVQFGIDKLPTITPESLVKHGKWIQNGFFRNCSECGATWHEQWVMHKALNYCPHCGAKMDLEESP